MEFLIRSSSGFLPRSPFQQCLKSSICARAGWQRASKYHAYLPLAALPRGLCLLPAACRYQLPFVGGLPTQLCRTGSDKLGLEGATHRRLGAACCWAQAHWVRRWGRAGGTSTEFRSGRVSDGGRVSAYRFKGAWGSLLSVAELQDFKTTQYDKM